MEWIKITTSTEFVRWPVGEIIFVKADGNYSDVYTVCGKSRKMTFKLHYFEDTFSQLRDNPFVRVGKSLVVNSQYVQIINLPAQELILAGAGLPCTYQLTASKDALRELKNQMEGGKL